MNTLGYLSSRWGKPSVSDSEQVPFDESRDPLLKSKEEDDVLRVTEPEPAVAEALAADEGADMALKEEDSKADIKPDYAETGTDAEGPAAAPGGRRGSNAGGATGSAAKVPRHTPRAVSTLWLYVTHAIEFIFWPLLILFRRDLSRRTSTPALKRAESFHHAKTLTPIEKPLIKLETSDDETFKTESQEGASIPGHDRPSQPPAVRIPPPPPTLKVLPHTLTKTLVLDLDETLIHSTSRPYAHGRGRGLELRVIEVVLDGRSTLYTVYKRPFVDFFLRTVATWYNVVIFTASLPEYADPVIDWLDGENGNGGMVAGRLFRKDCLQTGGVFLKDLSRLDKTLSKVFLIDNSPASYALNQANAIPIEGWINDPKDECLLDLLPMLDSLRFTNDVRHVLALRGFSNHNKFKRQAFSKA